MPDDQVAADRARTRAIIDANKTNDLSNIFNRARKQHIEQILDQIVPRLGENFDVSQVKDQLLGLCARKPDLLADLSGWSAIERLEYDHTGLIPQSVKIPKARPGAKKR